MKIRISIKKISLVVFCIIFAPFTLINAAKTEKKYRYTYTDSNGHASEGYADDALDFFNKKIPILKKANLTGKYNKAFDVLGKCIKKKNKSETLKALNNFLQVVRETYKKLAIKYHPDRYSNSSDEKKNSAEEEFKKLGSSYQEIRNFITHHTKLAGSSKNNNNGSSFYNEEESQYEDLYSFRNNTQKVDHEDFLKQVKTALELRDNKKGIVSVNSKISQQSPEDMLYNYRKKLNLLDKSGFNFLMHAAANKGYAKVITALIEVGKNKRINIGFYKQSEINQNDPKAPPFNIALWYAVKNNHQEAIKALLAYNYRERYIYKHIGSYSPFMQAVIDGNLKAVESFVSIKKYNYRKGKIYSNYPEIIHDDDIEKFQKKRIKVPDDRWFLTPLMVASALGHSAIVEKLLGHISDDNILEPVSPLYYDRDSYKIKVENKALLISIMNKRLDIATKLYEKNTSFYTHKNTKGLTPLMEAVDIGNKEIFTNLLGLTDDLLSFDILNDSRENILFYALRNKKTEFFVALIKKLIEYYDKHKDNNEIIKKQRELINLIKKVTYNPRHEKNVEYNLYSLLMLAAELKDTEALKALLQHPEINTQICYSYYNSLSDHDLGLDSSKDGKTALMIALEQDDNEECVKELVTYSKNKGMINDYSTIKRNLDEQKITPLMFACDHEKLSYMKILLDAGADPNKLIQAKDSSVYKGKTALYMCSKNQFTEGIELLLDNKYTTNPNLIPSQEFTPLMHACNNGDVKAVKAFVSNKKTDPNISVVKQGNYYPSTACSILIDKLKDENLQNKDQYKKAFEELLQHKDLNLTSFDEKGLPDDIKNLINEKKEKFFNFTEKFHTSQELKEVDKLTEDQKKYLNILTSTQVTSQQKDQKNLIMFAVTTNNIGILRFLHNKGVINSDNLKTSKESEKYYDNKNIIGHAISAKTNHMLHFLVEELGYKIATTMKSCKNGVSPWVQAIEEGNEEALKTMIKNHDTRIPIDILKKKTQNGEALSTFIAKNKQKGASYFELLISKFLFKDNDTIIMALKAGIKEVNTELVKLAIEKNPSSQYPILIDDKNIIAYVIENNNGDSYTPIIEALIDSSIFTNELANVWYKSKNADGDTLLVQLIKKGNLRLIKKVVKELIYVKAMKLADILNQKNQKNGLTPLLEALQAGHEDIGLFLLAQGASPDMADSNDSTTPLIESVKHNQVNVFNQLMLKKIDINYQTKDGKSAKDYAHGELVDPTIQEMFQENKAEQLRAAILEREKIAKKWLEYIEKTEKINEEEIRKIFNEHPLVNGVIINFDDTFDLYKSSIQDAIIEKIIKEEAQESGSFFKNYSEPEKKIFSELFSFKDRSEQNIWYLLDAIVKNHEKVVKFFIDNKFDISKKLENGYSMLMIAIRHECSSTLDKKKNEKIIHLLLDKMDKESLDMQDSNGESGIIYAAKYKPAFVIQFIKKGASINVKSEGESILTLLLKKDQEIKRKAKKDNKNQPIEKVFQNTFNQVLVLTESTKFSQTIKNEALTSLLNSKIRKPDNVAKLMELGADIKAIDPKSKRPIYEILFDSKKEINIAIVYYLISNDHLSPDSLFANHDTLLIRILSILEKRLNINQLKKVISCITKMVDKINPKSLLKASKKGETALYTAIIHGKLEIVKKILEKEKRAFYNLKGNENGLKVAGTAKEEDIINYFLTKKLPKLEDFDNEFMSAAKSFSSELQNKIKEYQKELSKDDNPPKPENIDSPNNDEDIVTTQTNTNSPKPGDVGSEQTNDNDGNDSNDSQQLDSLNNGDDVVTTHTNINPPEPKDVDNDQDEIKDEKPKDIGNEQTNDNDEIKDKKPDEKLGKILMIIAVLLGIGVVGFLGIKKFLENKKAKE